MNRQPTTEQWMPGSETIREWFGKADDIVVKELALGVRGQDERIASGEPGTEEQIVLIYCEGMTDHRQINELVLPAFSRSVACSWAGRMVSPELDLSMLQRPCSAEDMYNIVLRGRLVVLLPERDFACHINIAKVPNRTPEESNTEISIKGPRDAFIEDLGINVALVRKRLKTSLMRCEKMTIGVRSQTTVALLYIEDIANPSIVEEARKRLQQVNTDGLISSSQLEEDLADTPYSLFPLVDYSGRPEFTATCLLQGRIAVVVDGSPMALLAPANLTLLFKSPEDLHLPFYYVLVERLLRLSGLLLAVFLPGLWIAVTAYNLDQIPFQLVATIAASRLGLPLSGPVDIFIMLALFEIFREAGVRLPKAVGQTVAVVGGLIVGDAAIRAGITSPTTLVITAVTTVAMFTLINQSLIGSVTLCRIFVLLCSLVLGMFGFILSLLCIVVYLSSLTSLGVPYMAPLSPPSPKDIIQSIFTKPWALRKKRPSYLHVLDQNRKEEP